MTRIAAAVLVGALAGCALQPESPEAFRFGVMGDVPRNATEEARVLAMMTRIDAAPLAFVVHVGDFKAGSGSLCTDELFLRRRAEFDASAHPLILTPGDNDWTDCRNKSSGGYSPIERLNRLREIFFADGLSLGRSRIETRAQSACVAALPAECGCGALPENRLWTRAGVVFATLNVPGSENNVGYDAADDREALCRDAGNRAWLAEAARLAREPGARALVVAVQADPWAARKPVYRGLLRELVLAARSIGRPMLFIHGDTHTYRMDWPFVDEAGIPVDNLTRLETFGSPFVGWVEVSVDPGTPRTFTFQPHLEALVP